MARDVQSHPPNWVARHGKRLLAVALGWLVCLIALSVAGRDHDLINATTAYFVAANLVVVWWYADTTVLLLESSRDQVRVSAAQHEEAVRSSRIAHKPFVVIERVQTDATTFRYDVRNIGAGLAVNVWMVERRLDESPHLQTLGSLGAGGSRMLYGPLEAALRDQDGVFPVALIAEGLVSRTTQWTATTNVRERLRGTEMRNQPLPIRMSDKPRTIELLIAEDWEHIREALDQATAGI